ncbi:MAG: rod shape-determining protein MreC [Stellaceae bacterium]
MRFSPPVRAAAQRLALPTLLILSGVLVLLGRANLAAIDVARTAVGDMLAPVLEAVVRPLGAASTAVGKVEDAVAVYRENARLREENRRLLEWQEVARRALAENKSLRALDRLVPDHAASAISARVIADAGGAFMRNVLVDAGTQDGVARGQAALTGDGLVGRVAEVGRRSARILLLTDLNSHVPVMLEATSERAILEGDNSDRPRLAFIDPKAKIAVGARVVTSGNGVVFPTGLPVGMVAANENGIFRVDPAADLSSLNIVRLVDYGLGGVLPDSAVPPPRSSRPSRAHMPQEAAR